MFFKKRGGIMPIVLTDKSVARMTQEQLLLQCVREYACHGNYEPYEKDLGGGHIVETMPSFATEKGFYARRTLEFYEKRERLQPLSPIEEVLLLQHKTLGMLIDSTDFEGLSQFTQDEIISTYDIGKKWR